MKKKLVLSLGITLLLGLFIASAQLYASVRFIMKDNVVAIDSNLAIVVGGGGNSGILVGDSVVVVIDTKMLGSSEDLFKMAKEKAGAKQIIVINTHYHGDHVKGNKYFKGSRIFIGAYEKEFLQKNIEAENQPTDFVEDSLLIDLGSEQLHLYNLGQAHTWNDLVVYLSKRHLLFTGDLIFHGLNPVLKEESGANVSRWIQALDVILSRWGDSKIVPGHGKEGGREMADSLRQYFIDMTTAAHEPQKANQLVQKYADWVKLGSMTSPEKTIDYIRKTETK